MVTLVSLATVRVKVTITVSVFPWFYKENGLLSLFSVFVCVACVCTCNSTSYKTITSFHLDLMRYSCSLENS